MMEQLESYKRANFFPGLKATPAFWNEMEDCHSHKDVLYNTLHGYGIVLEYQPPLHVQAEKTWEGIITLLVGSKKIAHKYDIMSLIYRYDDHQFRGLSTGVREIE